MASLSLPHLLLTFLGEGFLLSNWGGYLILGFYISLLRTHQIVSLPCHISTYGDLLFLTNYHMIIQILGYLVSPPHQMMHPAQ